MIVVTQEVVPTKSLEHLRSEIIASAKRGYPILLSGALFFLVLAYLPLILPMTIVRLLWIFGLMVIFPLGILLGRILRVNVITTNNPLGTLGGLIAGTQNVLYSGFHSGIPVQARVPAIHHWTLRRRTFLGIHVAL